VQRSSAEIAALMGALDVDAAIHDMVEKIA